MNYKPTKLKLIVTTLVLVLWYLILFYMRIQVNCGVEICMESRGSFPAILPGCCPGSNFIMFILTLGLVLLPSIIIYILMSLTKKRGEKQQK